MRSVYQKIIAGFAAVLVLLTAISLFSYMKISEFNRDVNQALTRDIQLLNDYQTLSFNIANRVALARGYLLEGDARMEELFSMYTKKSRSIEKTLLHNTSSPTTQNLVKQSKEWETFINEDVFAAYQSGDRERAVQLMNEKGSSYATALIEGFNGEISQTQDKVTKLKEKLIESGISLKKTILFISLLAISLGILISFLMARMITHPIGKIVSQMSAVAQGDLRGQHLTIRSKDEIGRLAVSVNEMIDNLRSLVQQATETSEQVAAASEELASSAEQTSQATEHITLTIQEVAAGAENQVYSVEESSYAIRKTADHSQQISVHAGEVAETAAAALEKSEKGNKVVQKVIHQMTSINNTVKGLEEDIRDLGELSREIGQITATITGIAEQTNLLALNAAIEAARAGEHGKGFAVVAAEVRKLAEITSSSSQQVTQFINRIQLETSQAGETMKQTTVEVTEGITVAYTAGESFSQINESIHEVTNQIQQVSAAAGQMAVDTDLAVRSIDKISQVSEETSFSTQSVSAAAQEQLASMEEISSSSASLSYMAEELQAGIKRFKI